MVSDMLFMLLNEHCSIIDYLTKIQRLNILIENLQS